MFRDRADMSDFEYARDRIMMGIERRKLSMSDKERLHTAIHEAGHAIACYFSKGAKQLYKATIVARGSSLGAVSTLSKTCCISLALLSLIPTYRLTWCQVIVCQQLKRTSLQR